MTAGVSWPGRLLTGRAAVRLEAGIPWPAPPAHQLDGEAHPPGFSTDLAGLGRAGEGVAGGVAGDPQEVYHRGTRTVRGADLRCTTGHGRGVLGRRKDT